MNLLKLWQQIAGLRPDDNSIEERRPSTSDEHDRSSNRALNWLNPDFLERQRFYENWASRESWLIYDEGLTLLLGRDPDDPGLDDDTDFITERQVFWEHLQRCVSQNMPPAIQNPSSHAIEWRVTPVSLYRWAVTARLPVPSELDALLNFISSTVTFSDNRESDSASRESASTHVEEEGILREQVLCTMLALSLQLLHRANELDADELRDKILGRLYDKSELYFSTDEPPLSRPALHDLIDRSLEMAGLIYMNKPGADKQASE